MRCSVSLPQRAEKLTHKTILQLYEKRGIIQGSRNYPTLYTLRKTVADNKEANAQAKLAIIDSLDPVLASLGRKVLDHPIGLSTRDLARGHKVFEFGGISETDKNLLLAGQVIAECTSRIAQGISNCKLDLLIFLDEAQRLISPSRAKNGMAELIGLVRGTGIGFDLSVQTSDVAPAIFSNCANRVIGRCGSAVDYDAIGSAMGIRAEQRRWMSTHLRPGLFVGQVGEGNWRHPFLFRVPRLKLKVSDKKAASGAPESRPTTTGKPRSNWAWNLLPRKSDPLSTHHIQFMKAVIDHPHLPSSVYAKLAGIGAVKAKHIREDLVGRGYLREHKLATGKRGREAIVLEPLPTAFQAIGGSL